MNLNGFLKRNLYRGIQNKNFLAILLLIFTLAVFYRDVVFNGRTFLMETTAPGTMPNAGPYKYQGTTPGFVVNDAGAIAWTIEPFNRFISKSLKKGDFPLWNPYAGLAGSPLLADGFTGPLEPIQFFFFFFPNRFWPYTIDIQLLIRFFLAGFGCFLFAKRLKLNFWASVASGILFMLSSYFVTYGDHPQIKAESLLPLVLYGYDRLADREDKWGFWFCSLFIGWVIIAAMPESTFFGLFLGSLWYFYTSILQIVKRGTVLSEVKSTLIRYLRSTIFGFLISAAYLFPFIENLLVSKSFHIPGALNGPYPLSSLPDLIFQAQNIFYMQIGFFALFSLVYLLIGVTGLSKNRNSVIFFGSYAIIFILSIFNFPLTNWIRNLPVFNQLVLHKYSFPSIVFCLAILVGIFIDGMTNIPPPYKKISLSLIVVLSIFIILPGLGNPTGSLSAYLTDNELTHSAFGLIIVISSLVYFLAFLYKHQDISLRFMQVGLLILVASEPFFWESRINRPDRVDPYQTPPFVNYLQTSEKPFRIFGLDGILYPNISAAYQLSDIRWLDALIPKRVYDFSIRFLNTDEPKTIRFTGTQFPVSDKMFNLLNVKYVLAQNTLENFPKVCDLARGKNNSDQSALGTNTLANIIVQQNKDTPSPYMGAYILSINGSERIAIFNQPPEKMSLKLAIPQQFTNLDFSIGLNPQVFRPDRGDGVSFQVFVLDGVRRTQVFSKYIDPKNNPCDRKWFDESVGLDNWVGKDVDLEFSTDGGSAGNIAWDWAYWGDVRLSTSSNPAQSAGQENGSTNSNSYTLAHKDHDVAIYKNRNVLPHAFVAYHIVNVSNSNSALDMLADPKVDVGQTAIVENLPIELVDSIKQDGQQLQATAGSAKLINSGEVDVQTEAEAPGLLVDADQYYPGWEAFVDGKKVPIYAVDGIFRGVFLEKGNHIIKFIFKPLSFIFGGMISIVSLLITVMFIIFNSRLSKNHHE